MMYKLSQKNNEQIERHKQKIKEYKEAFLKKSEEIKVIRENENDEEEKLFEILEKQNEMEKIQEKIKDEEQKIENIFIKQMKEDLIREKEENENANENIEEKLKAIENDKIIQEELNERKEFEAEDKELKRKLKIGYMKFIRGLISEKEWDEMKKEINDRRREVKWILLVNSKGVEIARKRNEEIFNELLNKYIKENNKNEENINKTHKEAIYFPVRGFEDKIQTAMIEDLQNRDTENTEVKKIKTEMMETYSSGKEGEEAKLVEEFVSLEIKGIFEDYYDPYEWEVIKGQDNPQLLLKLEKVKGLDVKALKGVKEFDSIMNKEIYIATSEVEKKTARINRNIMKPITEYYIKNEEGKLEKIGEGTENETNFHINELEINVNPKEIVKGESLASIKQKELGEKLLKKEIEKSMGKNVGEVSEILNEEILKDIIEQCTNEEYCDVFPDQLFIVEIEGEEEPTIIIRNAISGEYKEIEGLEKTGNKNEYINKNGNKYKIEINEEEEFELTKSSEGEEFELTKSSEEEENKFNKPNEWYNR